jgi:hypothetical protein
MRIDLHTHAAIPARHPRRFLLDGAGLEPAVRSGIEHANPVRFLGLA